MALLSFTFSSWLQSGTHVLHSLPDALHKPRRTLLHEELADLRSREGISVKTY